MLIQMMLKDVSVGKTFEVWDKKFTVLKPDEDKVFVLASEFATTMKFRENDSEYKVAPNDFRDSSVKEYLNSEYIDELIAAGANVFDNIFPLSIDLECTLRQSEYAVDSMNVGLLTLKQYGEFYDIIPPTANNWWWLATPEVTPHFSPDKTSYKVWYVFPDGGCGSCRYYMPCGVRPVLNLNPCLLVLCEAEGDDWSAINRSEIEDIISITNQQKTEIEELKLEVQTLRDTINSLKAENEKLFTQ